MLGQGKGFEGYFHELKPRRWHSETVFGHKVFLSTGPSSLILDCVVERGNPADSNYVQPFLERHRELYGQVPRQSAWDGGFASAANLSWAKEQGVEDVAFAKKCGLTVESMVRSSWVYKELKRSRGALGPSSTPSVSTAVPGKAGLTFRATSMPAS